MKSITKAVIAAFVGVFLVGCDMVMVPPAHKGKVLTTKGYSPEILEPGKYTLWGRDELVVLQTGTNTYRESVKVIMSDKLTLTADVRFRGRISGVGTKAINAMFNDITHGGDYKVEFNEVYRIYGRMVVRNVTREILSKYTADDVHKNYARLSKEIGASVLDALKGTAVELSDVRLGDIAYPKVITEAVEAAAERNLSIKKQEAQAQIDLTKKKNERLLAEADYQIKVTKAKAERDSNKILGQGITPQLIELRRIEVLEKMADNKSAVFMPVEAMSSIGAQTRMFSK
jgi:regulator of protease activity HflC (stomatin/prohibitin superfamily)